MASAADQAAIRPETAPAAAGAGDFSALLSAVNPLQFLPGVGMIYRAATGDEGSPGLRTVVALASGALLGGPVGLLTGALGVLAFQVLHLDRAVLSALHDAGATAAAPAAVTDASHSTRDQAAARLAATATAAYGRSLELAGATASTGRG